MIHPNCDRCHQELQDFGALAFSPPETQPDGACGREVEKYHLCASCWQEFKRWLEQQTKIR
jgi:hypothetical protein